MRIFSLFSLACGVMAALTSGGCGTGTPAEQEVVIYTSVDQPYADPILREFEKSSGIRVRLVTDTEASKSVGLAERLRAEKANPQCDVWWGNEPFHTITLAEEGLLQPYESPSASEIPAMYRDPAHRWAGNGLRARVIAVRGAEPQGQALAISLAELASQASGKAAIARPTAGTTGGHVAALYVLWGSERADAFFRKMRENNVKVLGGNGPVAEAVGQGTVEIGLTDNDDVGAVQREGGSLHQRLPDQDGQGTLMIPTTVGLVAGTKRAEAAKKLVDYLLSQQVEQKLIDAKFSGWSVRRSSDVKAMQVDYTQVAKALPDAVRRATAILDGRE